MKQNNMTYLKTMFGTNIVYFNSKERKGITHCSIMFYKIQNNKCSTELEHHDNRGTPSLNTSDTVAGLKKLLVFCHLPLKLISSIQNSRGRLKCS